MSKKGTALPTGQKPGAAVPPATGATKPTAPTAGGTDAAKGKNPFQQGNLGGGGGFGSARKDKDAGERR